MWPYVGAYDNWPRAIHNGFDFTQQIYTTAMFGGAPILALPYGYVRHAENRHYVEQPFGVLAANEGSFTGFRNVPYAAVVYGYRNPPGYAKSGWWWKTDARSASLGAFAACLYGHVQVSSVYEGLLDSYEKLAEYRVLYLAGTGGLDQRRLENVRRFVREGGGLVVSDSAGLYDAAGKRLARFPLEDVLRVAPVEPSGELAETLATYGSMTGGPYDLYLAPRGNADTATLTPLWNFEPVRALEGGEVRMDIVTGEGLRAILPGVVFARYGKGRAVYCASALESLFLQTNNRAIGETIRSLVRMAAGAPPPYEIETPAAVIANLTGRGNARVLHLANWTGNKFERAGANEYYLAPVENVRIRIGVPEAKRVRAVSVLVKTPFREKRAGGTLEIAIPRLEAYQAVRIDLE